MRLSNLMSIVIKKTFKYTFAVGLVSNKKDKEIRSHPKRDLREDKHH
jgi:hypothetical protein